MGEPVNFGDERLGPRFWAKVSPCPMSGCWIWTGWHMGKGYGSTRHNGRGIPTHRLAYEALVGPIPHGLQLDHLCRVRCCCNPAHMEPVTQQENIRRGDAGKARGTALRERTHCKNGHPFSEDNTLRHGGVRHCRTCRRAIGNRYNRKRREGGKHVEA
jgi:hypothetical protein